MNREEAINVVRCNWPEGRHQLSEALRTLIPELQESEDEIHRKWILEYLYDGLRKADEKFKDHFKAAIDWLERQKEYIDDIRQYAYNKGLVDAEEKQKPAEWSEEDEKMRIKILEALSAYADHVQYTGFCANSELIRGELMAWLKSLRPRPHWKPSEVQMKSLVQAVGTFATFEHLKDDSKVLTSLYNDLKKLCATE